VGDPCHEPRRKFVESSRRRGGEPIFKVAPEAFDGVEFGRVGREKKQAHVGRHVERAGCVKSAVVEQEHMKLSGRGRSARVEEELKALRSEQGQCEKEPFPCLRFHCSVQLHTRKARGGREHGRDAAGGDPMAYEGQEPAATFLVRPHATGRGALLGGRVPCG